MKQIKLRLTLTLLTLTFAPLIFGQTTGKLTDKDLRIELEPASFALSGISGTISHTITEDDNLSIGLFGAALDVPDRLRPSIFNNVGMSDSTDARLSFEVALNLRYRINVFKEFESNPYIGLILGWEYFDIKQPSHIEKVRLSTWLATPYVGYEFYFYKQFLYLNPQLRSVFYFGETTSDATRPEELGGVLLLPQISIGVRL